MNFSVIAVFIFVAIVSVAILPIVYRLIRLIPFLNAFLQKLLSILLTVFCVSLFLFNPVVSQVSIFGIIAFVFFMMLLGSLWDIYNHRPGFLSFLELVSIYEIKKITDVLQLIGLVLFSGLLILLFYAEFGQGSGCGAIHNYAKMKKEFSSLSQAVFRGG